MARFGPKPWTNPFGEISIFRLFELFVFIAQKGVFLLQNITKHIFLTQIVLKKREKWPILDQNHGLSPLDKSQFFDFFNLLVFLSQKGVFLLQNILKHIFLAQIPKTRKMEKWLILDQNHGLTTLEKCQYLDSLNFSFYSLERRFSVLEYRKTQFPGLPCLKISFRSKQDW